MNRLYIVIIVAALGLASSTAWAAGIEYPDNGTIAIGRGGAWAANPMDGLAFQYNPAGLAQQRGLQVTADARLSFQRLKFTSTSLKGDPAENDAPPFLGPSGAVSYGLGAVGPLSELTFALGATGPSSIGKQQFPEQGVQRYQIQSTDYFIGFYSAAVAVGIGDWLRVGVTGQLAHGNATFSQAVYSGTTTGSEPSQDSKATFSGANGVKPAAVLGVTVLPTPTVAIGLSWRPAIHFAADGTLDTKVAEFAKNDAKQVGNSAELQLMFADVVRLGGMWKPTPRWEVELDAVWERWSEMTEIRVHTKNIKVAPSYDPSQSVNVPDIVFPHRFRDTLSLRLGGEHELLADTLRLRAGYLYESSAIPTKDVSVDFANWGRQVASVGASLHMFGAWLDVAYAHHFIDTQVVTDSAVVQQQTPSILPGVPAPKPLVVGNGTYQASLDIVSLSLRVPFGGQAPHP